LYSESGKKKPAKWIMPTLYTFCLTIVIFLGWYGAQLIYGPNSQSILVPYKSGYQVFINACNRCHPNGGNIMAANKPITNSPKLKDINTFTSFIRRPEGVMPSFPQSAIPDHETEELYRYISTGMNK
jgi:hypothetical protein